MNLKKFSKVNLARCISTEGFNHPLESWSEAEWVNAAAGEIGEYLQVCNTAKKIIRFRDSIAGNVKPDDQSITLLKYKAAKELSDIIIYCDLAIQRLGYDSSDMIKEVFNAKSLEIQSEIMYREDEE